ncbi:hypothetical protein E8E13_008048 [Curvularia kusanoi]|uniref:EGF-like domain-containing protein n=1 Tax=Curvularia kusanoi TaxID=90978 RepID=A0A9P4TG90_CURKU|nr:hypothetical protein E8E13_008048 [Curvularia kusanoi]
MSYEPRLAPRAYGDAQDGAAQKGSVRAARERMQAAQMRSQLPDTSKIVGLPQRPNQLISQRAANRDDGLQPRTPTDRRDDDGMPSPTPPWPLPNDVSPTIPTRSPNRLRPPQSSIRPVSDEFPIQQPSPTSDYPLSGEFLQPPSFNFRLSNKSDERPFSGASEASSLGSIPDFPVPQPPMPAVQPLPRRIPSLGPPPSARRGPSSYYTQMSYVSPIVEESETRSNTIRSRHGSYASSNVFPLNNDEFYSRDYPQSDDDETITSDRGTMSPGSDHNDESGLVKESPNLVRQASLGRRTKPSLMTIKSVDNIGDNKKRAVAGAGAGAVGAGGTFAMRDAAQGSPLRSSILSTGTGFIDPSTSSSSGSFSTSRNTNATSPSYTGAESPIFPFQPGPRSTTLAERVGFKRPPRLDMDTVRDAEARGSLTSLPDLIRRATRLAANLDRGKTASRLGLDFWEAGAPEQKGVRKSQNSLTDMLAAFPPPGQETPQRSGTPAGGNVMAEWPSSGAVLRSAGAGPGYSNEKPPKKRRRCCGLPLWTFITLLIVLLFIVAAAVVIPIVLVVIPNQNKGTSAAQDNQGNNNNNNNNNNPNAPAPTSSSGSGSSICQNGGVAIQNADKSTTCVCINGFTGNTCGTKDSTGCTTTSIMGTKNATVGSGIPRIVQSANSDFNVPLDATRILSLFSSLSLSCAAENALITFNGLASRSIASMTQPISSDGSLSTRSLPVLHVPHADPRLEPRQDVQPISSNTTAVDFARVGVLFALQQDGKLNTAATAQENVQDFLTSNRNGNSNTNTVDLGPFKMDLVKLTINFANGTTIGPGPGPKS